MRARAPIRFVRIVGGAALTLCAVAGVGYSLVSALPAPSAGDRVAVRVLDRLQSTRGRGGAMEIAGTTAQVRCRRLGGGRHLVTVGEGTRLLLSGTRVREVAQSSRLRLLASAQRQSPELTSAEADLSGSHELYAIQLAGQLSHGRTVVVGSTVVRGTPAYRLRLTRAQPSLELLVARRSLKPLVAVYRSASLSGRTVLGPSTEVYRWRAC